MQPLFWLCILGAAYSYVLYPLVLLLIPGRPQRRRAETAAAPSVVTTVIAAHNEVAKIAAKIENTLALTRPEGMSVEVLVASDASDDGTDAIVARYAERGVRLVRSPQRRGKEHAQGLAIAASRGDVLVFTDAGTILPEDSLLHLTWAFDDPQVGAVSSVDRVIADDSPAGGEGLYVRYEMWLRDLETRFGSLVGLSGSFFAARRVVCADWDVRVPSDFGTALNCVRLGLRAVSDRRVIGYYKNIADPRREYQRKVRTVTRGMIGLRLRREVLNPARFGRFAFQVFSHKLMRWAVPWLLAAALLLSSILALADVRYRWMLAAQLAFYLVAIIARIAPGLITISPVRLCAFFVEVNVAIMQATLTALSGRTMLTWEPSKR